MDDGLNRTLGRCVQVWTTALQGCKERSGMEGAASAGQVRIHGNQRGMLLIEVLDPFLGCAIWQPSRGSKTRVPLGK